MAEIIKWILKNKLKIILFISVLILGNYLRSFSYASVPHPGEVADEYSYGWVGVSLIKEGYPVSWSTLSPYKFRTLEKINVDFLYDKNEGTLPFPIVKPWFDHPPLFGLITGGYAYLKGARNFADASVILLRRPMLKIAILTTLLLFILAYRLYGVKVAFISSFLYSIVPTTVISSRLALIENGYIPIFLGSLILADLYFERKKRIFWILAVFIASLAVLFKLSAAVILLSLFLLALYNLRKDRKFAFFSIGLGLIIPFLVFAVYGAIYDWETFVEIFLANSGRFYGAGSEVILQLVSQFRFTTTKFLTDGWMIAGWISLLFISLTEFKNKKGGNFITISVLAYMVIFILFGSESYGWYKYPFFPFLMISISRLLEVIYEKGNVFVYTTLLFLPFGSSVHRLLGINGFQKYVSYIRIFSLVFLGIFILSLLRNKRSHLFLDRIYMILIFIFVAVLSVAEILFLTYESWFYIT